MRSGSNGSGCESLCIMSSPVQRAKYRPASRHMAVATLAIKVVEIGWGLSLLVRSKREDEQRRQEEKTSARKVAVYGFTH